MATLISNIKQLVGVREESKLLKGKELSALPCLDNAYLIIENGIISDFGLMKEIRDTKSKIENEIDASDQFILPCWCDSHTHLVFAASREEEFVDKIKGTGYAEIAAKGGGILNSAKRLNDISEAQLFDLSWKRLAEIARLGTGAVE